ncbi:hypothetical protein QBC44DRAFT_365894 [Cladorrhinum sp. PSN332]|nr:hypothetical protein QBC44DRAFT_365894 [Cladorrhinum sp. PSN332]
MDLPVPQDEGPSTLDIVSAIGTWAAALLAVVALLGIIAPYLALKSAQSDREQALKRVDSESTDYVSETFKITDNLCLRRVRVPLLHGVPNELGGPKLKDVITTNAALLDRKLLPISSTGWVDFAHLASVYIDQVGRGDPLVIRQQRSWLPVQRFVILAVGFTRLFTETADSGESTLENHYRRSKTAANVFGTTGAIWWRQTLREDESRFDEVCFAPHAGPLQQSSIADPTPLDELFRLAIGCLPVRDESGRIYRVLDLKYESRGPSKGYAPVKEETLVVFFKKCPSLNARHLQWASAMGALEITSEDLYSLDIPEEVMADVDVKIEADKSVSQPAAVGVLRLHTSPHAFLMLDGSSIFDCFSQLTRIGDDLKARWIFSRRRADLTFRIVSYMESASFRLSFPEMGLALWSMAVLIMTDYNCYQNIYHKLEERKDNDNNTLEVTLESQKVSFDGKSYGIDLPSLFPRMFADLFPTHTASVHTAADQTTAEPPAVTLQVRLQDISDVLLWVSVRMVAVTNTINSKPLLEMVKKMDDVVHVSPSTSPALIYGPSLGKSEESEDEDEKDEDGDDDDDDVEDSPYENEGYNDEDDNGENEEHEDWE